MQNESKIISLMRSWPQGAVLTSHWLMSEGYSKSLLQQYVRSGWIELVGKGAYRRVETDKTGHKTALEWQGGVYALQALDAEQGSSVLVAARTALQLGGYNHYINLSNKQKVWIFTPSSYHTPTWFKKYQWNAQVKVYSSKLFTEAMPSTISLKDWGAFKTCFSCPERAMMEVLELCPKYESLDHAKLLMESLATLRPKIITELLQKCSSIKVKRLFLALADICHHQWVDEIDLKKIDLGSGKRILEPGYGLHPKYQISVPKVQEG